MMCYFARPLNMFNSDQDDRDIRDLEKLGCSVIEIRDDETQRNARDLGMVYLRI